MDSYKAGKWEIFLQQGKMLGSEALDSLSSTLGIKLPEIVYNESSLRMVNEEHKVAFSINAIKALELTGFEKRSELLYTSGPLSESDITIKPSELKVSASAHWENRTVPKNTSFTEQDSEKELAKVCDFGNDWTFTTPYKGNFEGLNPIMVEMTDGEIPLERLGMNNPILWGGEVVFYEAELDDNGLCKFFLRIRAMQDCLFALLRLYLRVDHVMVRIYDTRIFHSFETREILREFSARESSYDELRENGFHISPQWSIDPRQSDVVYEHLKVVHTFNEKITY